MKNAKFILCLAAFAMVSISVANGAAIITATENPDGVLLTGTGSMNLLDLSEMYSSVDSSVISEDFTTIQVGDASPFVSGLGGKYYEGDSLEIPESLGPFHELPTFPFSGNQFGTFIVADIVNGDSFGVGIVYGVAASRWVPIWPIIFAPEFYISGDELSGTSFFEDKTFESLGMTPGDNYTWTWGTGTNQDSLTFMVVPEPSAMVIMLLGLIGLIGCKR